MKYYWSCLFNSGTFQFWAEENEDVAKKKMVKMYCGKPFDWGETSGATYSMYTGVKYVQS